MIIDAHHHLWKYDPQEYDWISDGMNGLRRDFLPADLKAVMRANGVDGAIAVQARQTLEETRWLLNFAETNTEMLGVVGWAPLYDGNIAATLEQLAERKKLRGIRHVLQDEADEHFMLREDFNRGIQLLEPLGLRYDILIYERHLPQTLEFVDRHPRQIFVLDHIAKPCIKKREISPWRERLAELAKRENVYCKLSGMVTEAQWDTWSAEALRPYWDAVLTAFGPKRIMFGSDWPVSTLASTYEQWLATVRELIAQLSSDEQARILSETAQEAYAVKL